MKVTFLPYEYTLPLLFRLSTVALRETSTASEPEAGACVASPP
ncbi:hypothetical protein SVIOM342S_03298 [Streptomyces violaceorubidus]